MYTSVEVLTFNTNHTAMFTNWSDFSSYHSETCIPDNIPFLFNVCSRFKKSTHLSYNAKFCNVQ